MGEQRWIKLLLMPLSWLYALITLARNFLFDQQILPSREAPQFVISIGNITVGGTGKTPVTEYLATLTSTRYSPAILSRGYGRKTTGFVLADTRSTPETLGDEPMQYYIRFKEKIPVAVCEKRWDGAQKLHDLFPGKKLLLLDDAFQHRAIRRKVNLLLNDFSRPFYEDHPFPAGRLRETRSGARRADAVILTKCPADLSNEKRSSIEKEIARYTRTGTPIFFSEMVYDAPKDYRGEPVALNNVKMVAGIANPTPFAAYLDADFSVLEKSVFPDHHNYTSADLNGIIHNLKSGTFVVTTEKDMVKLKPLAESAGVAGRFAFIPMTVSFGPDTTRFNEWIFTQIGGRA